MSAVALSDTAVGATASGSADELEEWHYRPLLSALAATELASAAVILAAPRLMFAPSYAGFAPYLVPLAVLFLAGGLASILCRVGVLPQRSTPAILALATPPLIVLWISAVATRAPLGVSGWAIVWLVVLYSAWASWTGRTPAVRPLVLIVALLGFSDGLVTLLNSAFMIRTAAVAGIGEGIVLLAPLSIAAGAGMLIAEVRGRGRLLYAFSGAAAASLAVIGILSAVTGLWLSAIATFVLATALMISVPRRPFMDEAPRALFGLAAISAVLQLSGWLEAGRGSAAVQAAALGAVALAWAAGSEWRIPRWPSAIAAAMALALDLGIVLSGPPWPDRVLAGAVAAVVISTVLLADLALPRSSRMPHVIAIAGAATAGIALLNLLTQMFTSEGGPLLDLYGNAAMPALTALTLLALACGLLLTAVRRIGRLNVGDRIFAGLYLLSIISAVRLAFVDASLRSIAATFDPGDPRLPGLLSAVDGTRNLFLMLELGAIGATGVALSRTVTGPLATLLGGIRRARSGEERVQVAVASRDEVGEVTRSFNDMIERLADSAAALERAAHYDDLTGLPNKVLFRERLDTHVRDSGGVPLAVMSLDLDSFTEINDGFGHDTGDRILRQLADRLRRLIGPEDTLARVGGDAFAILLANAGPERASESARGLEETLREPFSSGGHTVQLAAGISVVLYPDHGLSTSDLLRHAEATTSAAKRANGGPLFYDPASDPRNDERLALIADLRVAAGAGQLELHYQPIVRLPSAQVCAHVEGLVRWRHPRRGLVPPGDFMRIAEETGLIHDIWRWTLYEGLGRSTAMKKAGASGVVAINFSIHNLRDEGVVDVIADAARSSGCLPGDLIVEVTETQTMADFGRTQAILRQIAQLGASIAIDDYGTGYSSLAYLQRLPVNELKIDMSFVRAMRTEAGSAAIVASTIALGHRLGFTVVAEGVEDRETLELLASLGCDLAQGFVIGKPMPFDVLAGWLAGRASVSEAPGVA